MTLPSYPVAYAIALILSLSPLKAASQSCAAKCSVLVYNGDRINWIPKQFSTTIVAATVVQIVNTDLHTTSLSTEYNEIPAGYTVPTNTNAQGTQTVVVTYARSGQLLTTDLTFPTPFNEFPDRYEWQGTLPTTDTAGKSICSTASSTATGLVDYWSQDSTFTTPTHTYGPDPGGLFFTTSYTEIYISMAETYKSLFPNEVALQTCSIIPAPFPAVVELTARFITATTVSYVGGSPSPTPGTVQESVPPSNPTPATSSKASPSRTRTTQTVTSASLSTIVSEGPSGPVTTVNTVEITSVGGSPSPTSGTVQESVPSSNPTQATSSKASPSRTRTTQTVTSASLSTIVSEGPSGPVTTVNTVEITSVTVSTPEVTNTDTTATTNNAPGMGSSTAMWTWLVGFVILILMHLMD